jgi:hypothetical protein
MNALRVSAHLITTTCPTRIEAFGGFELVWVKRCIEVEHVHLSPPGLSCGKLLVCLDWVELSSAKKATVFDAQKKGQRKKEGGIDAQEGGIVVRGGGVVSWRSVEVIMFEGPFELIKRHVNVSTIEGYPEMAEARLPLNWLSQRS